MDIINHILQSAGLPVIILVLALMLFLSRSPRFKGLVILLNILVSLRYILWRGFFTLNSFDFIALSISVTLLLAEFYGFMQNILFYYQSARVPSRTPPDAENLPVVDIFITIYNEPKDILLRTIIGCQAQDYPKEKLNIYVLDDGRRDEIRELSQRLKTRYIARQTNEDAKAGNLNNALRHSEGEVVAIFDCDHIPVRSFLKETTGFFADPKVAIVQVPHHFYNPDTFQRNLMLEREITNEQDLFFHIIQPGRDYYNSAFFAGSCGLFRRNALEEIGGIVTKTITEDLHTSMVLHARGYKSVYLDKDLSAGLSPESCAGYINQRQRWAKGGAQVFVLDNPLFKKGLSLQQRLQYFASVIYFFHGLPRIIYLAAPLSYLLFRYTPIVTDVTTLLSYFLPHYAATLIAFNMVSRGYRNPFWSDVYETLMSFVLTFAVFRTVFKPIGHTFAVTPKGVRHENSRLEVYVIMPHIILAGLLIFGSVAGLYDLFNNGGNYGALAISLSWASYNLVILIAAIIAARERPQKRDHIRLTRDIRCDISLPEGKLSCRTRDLSETGLSLQLDRPMALLDPVIGIDLVSDYGEVTHLKGRVVRNDRDKDGDISVGINFIEMNEELNHCIIRQMFSPENSWAGYHDREIKAGAWSFFAQVISTFSNLFRLRRSLRRTSPRYGLAQDFELVMGDDAVPGVTRDISLTGLSMEISGTTQIPREVVVRARPKDGPVISAKGEVVWRLEKDTKILLGIRFSDPKEGRALWDGVVPSC